MSRYGSIIAGYIDRDYKIKKLYENRKRVNCKIRDCDKCQFKTICEGEKE